MLGINIISFLSLQNRTKNGWNSFTTATQSSATINKRTLRLPTSALSAGEKRKHSQHLQSGALQSRHYDRAGFLPPVSCRDGAQSSCLLFAGYGVLWVPASCRSGSDYGVDDHLSASDVS